MTTVSMSEEVLALLRGIESGVVTVTPLVAPNAVYCGEVEYRTSTGWFLTVYNDCYEWDYLSKAEDPSGRALTYSDMSEELQDYEAPDDDWDKVWKLDLNELPTQEAP